MGREKIFKKIKSNSIVGLVCCVILGVICCLITVVFTAMSVEEGTDEGYWVPALLFGILLIVCVWGAIVFAKGVAHPENAHALKSLLKKNPDLLYQADELYQNIIYQDDFLILSPRIIANAKNIREMSYTDEVFLIYVYTHKTNGVTDQKQLILQTARGSMGLNIYRKKDAEVDALAERVMQNCRYARAGFTQEGLEYVEHMRELWKKDQLSKQTVINGEVQ